MLRLPRSQSRRQRSGALYLGNVDNRSLAAALWGELNRSALDVVSDDVNLIGLAGGKAGKEIAAVPCAEKLGMVIAMMMPMMAMTTMSSIMVKPFDLERKKD